MIPLATDIPRTCQRCGRNAYCAILRHEQVRAGVLVSTATAVCPACLGPGEQESNLEDD